MCVVSWRRADVVKCLGLKPCSPLAGERNSLIEGKMSASRRCLAMGIGMTNAVFQIDGRRQDLREPL